MQGEVAPQTTAARPHSCPACCLRKLVQQSSFEHRGLQRLAGMPMGFVSLDGGVGKTGMCDARMMGAKTRDGANCVSASIPKRAPLPRHTSACQEAWLHVASRARSTHAPPKIAAQASPSAQSADRPLSSATASFAQQHEKKRCVVCTPPAPPADRPSEYSTAFTHGAACAGAAILCAKKKKAGAHTSSCTHACRATQARTHAQGPQRIPRVTTAPAAAADAHPPALQHEQKDKSSQAHTRITQAASACTGSAAQASS